MLVALVAACSSQRRSTAGAEGGASASSVGPRGADDASRAATISAGGTAGLPHVEIATGEVRETNYRIGQDLAAFVAPDAGVVLDVMATHGSADNLHRLSDDRRVDLAIVQYDVLQAFVDEAAHGNAVAAKIVEPLRVVTPLYTEEMYFVVRSDAAMKSIDDIRGKRINLGARGSGSALTAANVYRRMFQVPLPPKNAQYENDERALSALTVDKTVDVVVVVAAQPTPLFGDMKTQAGAYIKLLALDERSAAGRGALKTYFPATIRARNYPWLKSDVPTLSVMSFLVTNDRDGTMKPHLAGLARSLCAHLASLRAEGHPKWREVGLGRQLVPRWSYDAASAAEFSRCTAAG